MNTNDKQDFINEVENDEINAVIEPEIDDEESIDIDDNVHLIGGEAFGDDADYAPETFVMDVDSDGVFDFAIADVNDDGFIDAHEVLVTLDDFPDDIRGNIIGLKEITPEDTIEDAAIEPDVDHPHDEGDDVSSLENPDDMCDDNVIDDSIMPDGLDDII
ncbi:MAG: hypothetical protein J5629_11155 [Muribaculaceae bacterium]|nr:hypothetical protein [Muribaculaceae bacterium]